MEYAALREEISQLEGISAAARRARRADDTAEAISKLMPGDVIWVPRQGWCVVLAVGQKQSRDGVPWAQIIAADHTILRLRPHDLPGAPAPVARVRVPRRFSAQDSQGPPGAPGVPVRQAGIRRSRDPYLRPDPDR